RTRTKDYFSAKSLIRPNLRGPVTTAQPAPGAARAAGSAGRPAHGAAAENMNMQVEHILRRLRAVGYDQPEGIAVTLLAPHGSCREQQMAEQSLIVIGGIDEHVNGFFRNDENVHGCLRVDVPKGQAQVILVDDVCVDFPVDDPGEYGFGHGWCPLSRRCRW